MDSKKLALSIAAIATSKKAENALVLDMRALSAFCDYFVILGGTSIRQVNAVSDAIQEELAKLKIKPVRHVPSNDESGWIVLDFGSVVAHVFYNPLREFYALERLWSDAKKVRIPRKVKA